MKKIPDGFVTAVCLKAEPGLPKYPTPSIELVTDFGVRGDYHAGKFIRHRYLARKDPTRLNNRQVLIVDTGMLTKLAQSGIALEAGMMGENILVAGIAVMNLGIGTTLAIGDAVVELSEVRDPCDQLNAMHPGLMDAVTAEDGIHHQAGMLGRVLRSGKVKPGENIQVLDAN